MNGWKIQVTFKIRHYILIAIRAGSNYRLFLRKKKQHCQANKITRDRLFAEGREYKWTALVTTCICCNDLNDYVFN